MTEVGRNSNALAWDPQPDGDGFQPRLMADVELTQPLPDLPGGTEPALVLVRLHSEPIGMVQTTAGPSGVTADALASAIRSELHDSIAARLADTGVEPGHLSSRGLTAAAASSRFLHRRAEVLADAPSISVIVCTRDRPHRIAACLDRLAAQKYPDFEVVVVDNAPMTDDVRGLVEGRPDHPAIRYIVEPRPGLSRARNRGAGAATGDVLAFLDDDEAPDEHWLAELARGFASDAEVGCVTGMILPARLETQAQEWFEQFGGHSKGRGFNPAVFSRHGEQSPLYPLPPFGAGGNMAFRRDVLHAIGGFDVALGAGTPARGGEDTLAITLVLLAGRLVAYQPSALVRHDHYADLEGLARQLHGYGTGLTAFYSALLRRQPSLLWPLLRLLPAAVRDLWGKDSVRTELMRDFPHALIIRHRRGMLGGPLAYARARRLARAEEKCR